MIPGKLALDDHWETANQLDVEEHWDKLKHIKEKVVYNGGLIESNNYTENFDNPEEYFDKKYNLN